MAATFTGTDPTSPAEDNPPLIQDNGNGTVEIYVVFAAHRPTKTREGMRTLPLLAATLRPILASRRG